MTAARDRLTGRIAVVTGAASGIGRATALLFAAEGAHVVAIDRDARGNLRVTEELKAAGGRGEAVTLDLADRRAVARVADELSDRHPRIDVLFNNAGAVVFAPAAEATDEQWDDVVDTNLRGAFMFTRHLLPSLMRAEAAAVVNNASIDGVFAHPRAPLYSVAKAGMVGMTRALAYELGSVGVRVNCLTTGGIETPLVESFPQAVRDELARATPIRRWGTPEEVARVALFLASEEASFVTGAVLAVDGGRSAITAGVLGPPPDSEL